MKKENENPSVGLLLCAAKNDEVVELCYEQNYVTDVGITVSVTVTR